MLTSERCTHLTCKTTKVYIYLCMNLFENGCVYIYSLDEFFCLFIMSSKLRLLKKLLNASFLYLPTFKLIPFTCKKFSVAKTDD